MLFLGLIFAHPLIRPPATARNGNLVGGELVVSARRPPVVTRLQRRYSHYGRPSQNGARIRSTPVSAHAHREPGAPRRGLARGTPANETAAEKTSNDVLPDHHRRTPVGEWYFRTESRTQEIDIDSNSLFSQTLVIPPRRPDIENVFPRIFGIPGHVGPIMDEPVAMQIVRRRRRRRGWELWYSAISLPIFFFLRKTKRKLNLSTIISCCNH